MSFRHVRNARGFLSDYYLGSVFGRSGGRGGKKKLSDRDSDWAQRRFVRLRDSVEGRVQDSAQCRERFVRPLLRDIFDLHLGAGEDRIHALFTSAEAEQQGARPLLLAWCGGWDDDLDGGVGAARPMSRLEQALAQRAVRYGLLVTGERVRLVRGLGEGPRGAYLEVDLAGLADADDPDSFALAWRLLRATHFVPGADGHADIDATERASREHARKVSDDLKDAVFRSADSLVAGLIEDAVARGAVHDVRGLDDAQLRTFRDAALLCLYRVIFILFAEDRDTRLPENQVYWKSYSAHGLLEEIVREPAREWAENSVSLWARVLALFQIYDEGFPAIAPWEHIPPRGGEFFSRQTREGKLLESARLSDKTLARLLQDLATTAPRRGVGRERVSFRELDIEQLGHVYEGLLEYEPRIARETTIEVRVSGKVYALAVDELVRLCNEKDLKLRGDFALVAGTLAEGLHPESIDEEAEVASESAGKESKGISKGAPAVLLRRLEPGSFHFVPGAARKGSGSFYTPLPLVRDVIRHALGPLVKDKSPREIEALRVLDPACGSAHFLVEAMRYLGRELHRAYVEQFGREHPPEFRDTTRQGWDDHWRASDEEARASNSEARAWCKRRIAERCLFGVDMNPTAVGLARVALWIESLAGDRPLTYFEHHVRPGNSLLGTWLKRLERPPLVELSKAEKKREKNLYEEEGLFQRLVRDAVNEAAEIRRRIDAAPEGVLRQEGIDPESVAELRFKEAQRKRAEELLGAARLLFDLRAASAFVPAIWGDYAGLSSYVDKPGDLLERARKRPWWPAFERVRARERFFHWELEFPEVLTGAERHGFDVVLGNPPWDKVLPNKHEFYMRVDVLIRAYKGNDMDRRVRELHAAHPGLAEEFDEYRERTRTIARSMRQGGDFKWSKGRSAAAHEDLSKYFVDRGIRLTADGGAIGMILPSVVYNGDGCVTIRKVLLGAGRIERFYAFENRKKIFPIDSRYKFVSLVFRRGEKARAFEAAFMRHELDELESDAPKPWMVRLSVKEIATLSPETFAFLEYRSPRDQEIVRRMSAGRPTLGGDGPGSWGTRFMSWRAHSAIFNAAEDKDLFTNPETGRLHSPESVLGSGAEPFDLLLMRMQAAGFIPVFEGKQIDQFVVGTKSVRWWLAIAQAEQKYDRSPRLGPTLVFRDLARNTDERTCIACVLPASTAGSHTLNGASFDSVDLDAAATVLNSLCFDFALRLRLAGTHASFTYMAPSPVPAANVTNDLPSVSSRQAWQHNIEHLTDREALWPDLWEANRAVADAYGLSPDDLDHILESFPGMAKKRKPFVAYFRVRLAEWRATWTPPRVSDERPARSFDSARAVAEGPT